MARHPVAKVVYISCDPATLARDAAHLVHAGYRVKQVAVADMFLHTAHMETLVLLKLMWIKAGASRWTIASNHGAGRVEAVSLKG